MKDRGESDRLPTEKKALIFGYEDRQKGYIKNGQSPLPRRDLMGFSIISYKIKQLQKGCYSRARPAPV